MTKITTQYVGNSSCLCRSQLGQTLATLAHHFADCCCDSIWHCALSHPILQSEKEVDNTKLSAGLRRQRADILDEPRKAIDEISEEHLDALWGQS